jgi:small subunit ribosomal protein S8
MIGLRKLVLNVRLGAFLGLKALPFMGNNLKICFLFVYLLYKEGYILGFMFKENILKKYYFDIFLKYKGQGICVIKNIDMISKPGQRVYIKASSLYKINGDSGIFLMYTSKGFITDSEARALNVGGELVCSVF